MTVTYSNSNSKIKKLTPNDPDWFMSHDNVTLTPRAGLEISNRCPENYQSLIQECIKHGWLKPVAYLKESDWAWEQLEK